MRLQNILQSLLQCVVGLAIAGTLLALVLGQVGRRAGRLVLVLAETLDRVENVQEIGRHRADRLADELLERTAAATAVRAGLQELLDVRQPQRAGRNGRMWASVAIALATGRVALPLVRAVVAIVVVTGIAWRVLLAVAMPVVTLRTTLVTSPTVRSCRSGRAG
ncbi:hypothetical protein [Mesorhizobium sp. B2-8-5]|uniref:hypothetical protein n=1 Tax=Mesorhizobium sp. B2-8-5 TaxID=2589903 RepID=UPI001D02E568|nr:hypothetical protein [Mesorhizobium sp. B2-8-5]UCI25596.1 hypothetical protein FJ430_29205 [Mesorhizobium sp. B2-8-5]